MATFNDLPVETLEALCGALRDSGDKAALGALAATCRHLRAITMPYLWSRVHLAFDDDNYSHTLHRCEAIARACTLDGSAPKRSPVTPSLQPSMKPAAAAAAATTSAPSSPSHRRASLDRSFKTLIREVEVSTRCLAVYDGVHQSDRGHRVDVALSSLLRSLRHVERVHLDAAMSQVPLPLLVNTLAKAELDSLTVTGIYGMEMALVKPNHSLRRLQLGYVGDSLSLDLASFPALTELHLELDYGRPYRQVPLKPIVFPPSLWTHLRVLNLKFFPWDTPDYDPFQSFESSFEAAKGHVVLDSLALLWTGYDPDSYQQALRLFARAAGHTLRQLCVVQPRLVNISDIDSLSQLFPNLEELGLAAHMTLGRWPWPVTHPHEHATAFSNFPMLRRLLVNHDPGITATPSTRALAPLDITAEGGLHTPRPDSPDGLFTYECEESSRQARLDYAHSIAKACSGTEAPLEKIVFLPLQQESNHIRIQGTSRSSSETRCSFLDSQTYEPFWSST